VVVQAFVTVLHGKLLVSCREQGLRQDFKVGLKGLLKGHVTDFVYRRAVRTKDLVRWSLVKGVLWLILLNISISEVVAGRRCVLMMHRWEASTEEEGWRSGAMEMA